MAPARSLPNKDALSLACKGADFVSAESAAISAIFPDPVSASGHRAVRIVCPATNSWVIFAVPAGRLFDHTLPDFCHPPEKSSAPEMMAFLVAHSLP